MSVVTKDTKIFLWMRWNPIGAHHMYYGPFISWAGWEMMKASWVGDWHGIPLEPLTFLCIMVGVLLFALGPYVSGDDIYQHRRQVWDIEPMYHSPVHNFYGKYLYGIGWVKKLNIWFDKQLDRVRS